LYQRESLLRAGFLAAGLRRRERRRFAVDVRDGCVFINRTRKHRYESYDFTNVSRGILELFVSTCALVGVDCRVYENTHGSVDGRA
jgi:hypothetical protein